MDGWMNAIVSVGGKRLGEKKDKRPLCWKHSAATIVDNKQLKS